MSIRDPDEESSPANIMKMDGNFCVRSDKLKNVVIETLTRRSSLSTWFPFTGMSGNFRDHESFLYVQCLQQCKLSFQSHHLFTYAR